MIIISLINLKITVRGLLVIVYGLCVPQRGLARMASDDLTIASTPLSRAAVSFAN
jgi:hypothetical protein